RSSGGGANTSSCRRLPRPPSWEVDRAVNSLAEVEAAPRPKKQEQEEASDEITEVAPGVLRLQLPIRLPGLGHVNCYALEDSRGIALVDPGLPGNKPYQE